VILWEALPMRKAAVLFIVLALALSPLGCKLASVSKAAASEKPRITNPDVTEGDLTALAAGNSSFALELYQALRGQDGNLFYSPFSISLALAMTFAGARNETERQMAGTLRFTLSQEALHQAFNALDQELASRGAGAAGKDGKGFRLNIVNAVWGQRDFRFLASFLDTIAENYGAGIRLLDFIKEPEKSRVTINDWVSEETEERIKDLIPAGAIDALTRMVLTNAIYFNAAWQHPFAKEATAEGLFHLLDGSEVTKQMMTQTESFGHMAGGGYQVVELPYDRDELSMVVVLPDEGRFEEIEACLDAGFLGAALERVRYGQVRLTMPKWEFESEFGLKDVLAGMGMPVAFSDAADFSGMTGNPDLAISEVIHKAFVAVDEAGTEAAAATAVIMRLTAMPGGPVEVTIDRPFVFFIRDIQTGSILFAGRVVK
jgi:serpin B